MKTYYLTVNVLEHGIVEAQGADDGSVLWLSEPALRGATMIIMRGFFWHETREEAVACALATAEAEAREIETWVARMDGVLSEADIGVANARIARLRAMTFDEVGL